MTMTAGSISNNFIVANPTGTPVNAGRGGGVYFQATTTTYNFDFSGGTISNNVIAGNSTGQISGGGVDVYATNNATVTMRGTAKITGNKLVYPTDTKNTNYIIGGAGVHVTANSVFNMEAGEISGNSIDAKGRNANGAVFNEGTFTMSGGTITGNSATSTKTVATKGLFVVKAGTATLSDSASIPDGITLAPDSAASAYPKLTIPSVPTNSFTLTLQVHTTLADASFTAANSGWPTKVILTGAGAVGAIGKFTLGNFVKTGATQDTPLTPIDINTTHELTNVSSEAQLTAK
jgi:hypothetical protein